MSSKTKRVTRVEQNRRARRKELLKAEGEAKKVDVLSKEIDCIPDIIEEIAKEDEEKHKRHFRRFVARQERLRVRPPRLGKHKFEPAPVQVLLSEEISGSLRKLKVCHLEHSFNLSYYKASIFGLNSLYLLVKGCSTLARDRFKSFEKRGLLVPTAKSSRLLKITSHF